MNATPPVQWTNLVGLGLATLLGSLGMSVANLALPTLVGAFDVPASRAQWVVLAYLLGLSIFTVPAGRLGDLIGARTALLIGLAIYAVGAALSGMAPDLRWLIAARGVQGVGAAFLITLSISAARAAVPRERLGSAMGLLGTMSAVGTALGPSAGGVLIEFFGWRTVFYALVPLAALAALTLGHMTRTARTGCGSRGGSDWTGLILLALSLGGYAVAMTAPGRFGLMNWIALSIAVAGCWAFLRVERRSATPQVRLAAFKHAPFRISFDLNALVTTVMMGMLVVGPFYLDLALGLSEAAVGLVLAIGPITSMATGVLAGRATDRFGAERMILAGLAVTSIGALSLAWLGTAFGVWGYAGALLIMPTGYQLFLAANTTAIQGEAEPGAEGEASGLLNLSRNLGFITGASLVGTMFTMIAGSDAPEDVTRGFVIVLMALSAFVALSILPAWAARPARKRRSSTASQG